MYITKVTEITMNSISKASSTVVSNILALRNLKEQPLAARLHAKAAGSISKNLLNKTKSCISDNSEDIGSLLDNAYLHGKENDRLFAKFSY